MAMRLARGIVLAVVALLLAACATGGPAGTDARTRCADDRGEPGLRPMIFIFCVQSP